MRQGAKLVPTVAYLQKSNAKSNQKWDSSMNGIINALQTVSAKLVYLFHSKINYM